MQPLGPEYLRKHQLPILQAIYNISEEDQLRPGKCGHKKHNDSEK